MHTHRVALRQKARERDRERDRWKERYRGGERKSQKRRDRQVRVQFTHIVPPKLVCVRGKFSHSLFSYITYFLLCILFSSAPPIQLPHRHRLLLSTLKYNNNCNGNTPVGFHLLFYRSTPILTCHAKIIACSYGRRHNVENEILTKTSLTEITHK